MKGFILVLVFTFFLIGCGGDKNNYEIGDSPLEAKEDKALIIVCKCVVEVGEILYTGSGSGKNLIEAMDNAKQSCADQAISLSIYKLQYNCEF